MSHLLDTTLGSNSNSSWMGGTGIFPLNCSAKNTVTTKTSYHNFYQTQLLNESYVVT